MSDIRTSITLVDNFSGTAKGMAAAMSSAASECEKMKKVMGTAPDMSEYSRVREQFTSLGDTERQAAVQARATANALEEQSGKLRQAAQAAQAKADAEQKAVTIYEQEYRAYEKSANELGVLTEAQKKSISRYKEAYEEKKRAAQGAQDLADKLKTEAEMADKAAQSARKEADAYGEVNTVTQKTGGSFSSAADSLSNLMIAAGGYKILGFVKDSLTEAASAAIEFESAMTGVFKTVDGTPEQLAGLSNAVRDMATQIPASTTEIAGVMESAGQLGIKTENIESFTKTMIQLGTATNMTADEAASSLARFANVTQMSADDYDNLGSTIVALGNNFATTESEITNMTSYLSSAASLAGFSQSEILGLSTAMLSMGINAEAGGSAMSRLITEMQTAAETGSEKLEQFASVAGMTGEQFKNAFTDEPIQALQAFISGLSDVERNGASASVILQQMDLDDIRLSNTIKALASNSGILSSAVETANSAWSENSALTNEAEKRYATLESKMQMMQNAANDLKISIGNALTPALSGLTDAATGALKGLSSFADENQALTAGVTGFVGTIGTAIGGLTTLAPAITAVSTAYKAFDKTLSLSKIGLIVGGISLAVGAIAWLTTAFSNAEDAVEDYNGTLEECRNEIEQTRAEYEAVISMYGEQSAAAQRAAEELNTLNKQYEQGGGALADYTERIKANAQSFDEMQRSYREQIDGIANSAMAGQTAVAQLARMSGKTDKTTADLELMSKYANYLNDTFHCNIEVDYNTGELTGFDPNDTNQVINAMAAEKAKDNAFNYLSDPKTKANIKEYYDTLKKTKAEYDSFSSIGDLDQEKQMIFIRATLETDESNEVKLFSDANTVKGPDKTAEEWDSFGEVQRNYQAAKKQVESAAADINQKYIDMGYSAEEASRLSTAYMADIERGTATALEGTAESIGSYASESSAKLSEVRQAYSETYEAALKSIQGQFGLFDEAAVNAEMSADKFINAQKKQAQYWNEYADNINAVSQYTAQELGVSEEAFAEFKVKITDHSQESVALAHEMANGSTESAKQIVQAFETTYKAEQNAAQATSEWQSGLSATVSKTVTDTLTSVDSIINGINSNAGAFSTAGTNVGNAFTAALSLAMNGAISAAQTVASSVQSIFNSINVSVPKVNSPSDIKAYFDGNGYATGTLNAAPGLALVGEKGPELINFGGGEVVYTADETKRMMQSMTDVYIPKDINEAIGMKEPEWNGSWSDGSGGSRDKTITINIGGGDTIRVQGGVSRDDVCDLLVSNLKPALMSIISEEIFEEGEGSYEY